METKTMPEDGLTEDLGRFQRASRAEHEAKERAKALDGRDDEVARRQDRADRDNQQSD